MKGFLGDLFALFFNRRGGIFKALRNITEIGECIMASIQELKDAVANEAAEVKTRLDELQEHIEALQEQLAAGENITAADLDEVKLAIENIFTPAPLPPVA